MKTRYQFDILIILMLEHYQRSIRKNKLMWSEAEDGEFAPEQGRMSDIVGQDRVGCDEVSILYSSKLLNYSFC